LLLRLLSKGVNYTDDASVSNDVIAGTYIAQNSFYIYKMAI